MFIPRIYYPTSFKMGENVASPPTISHYLLHVLRCGEGDRITLFNGEGGEYSATVRFNKKNLFFEITAFDPVDRESPCKIHLGQSIVRGDRMDFAIQKATELGVYALTPLISHHCVVKIKEAKSEKKKQHWQNIAISASEQCGRTKIPIIHDPISLEEWGLETFLGTSLIFDKSANDSIKTLSKDQSYRIAVGPESGWHENEIVFLQTAKFISCQLGPRILRTETAGMTAITALQLLFGDL